MSHADTTCWTLIHGAASGHARDRDAFARRYEPAARAYLTARWRRTPFLQETDDAVQEAFVECFRQGGALERVHADRTGGFRAFFYGVLRNVALRVEDRAARRHRREAAGDTALRQLELDETRLSQVFDRAWAESIMRQAAERQAELAAGKGEEAVRRVELLRLRFHDNLPIREIAACWNIDAALVHREYAKARKEFCAALLDVVQFHRPGDFAEAKRECEQLLGMLA